MARMVVESIAGASGSVSASLHDTLPEPFAAPTIKAGKHRIPVPEMQRQVTPRNAGLIHIDHCVYKEPIVVTATALWESAAL